MKTMGLIGGMSWESTIPYYRVVNEVVKERLGGFHSAKLLMYSVDFAEIEKCQAKGEWDKSADILTDAAQSLQQAGADFIVICTNTMHKIVPQMQAKLRVPILHIADATAEALKRDGVQRVALLGTKYTMTQAFYKDRLKQNGLDVLTPEGADVELVNHVIYDELCLGTVSDASRREFARVIDELKARGAQGVVLGCTEIGLLVRPCDSSLPVYDTTLIHAQAAADMALA